MWINEIHYDNYGSDEGEFIEIVAIASMDVFSASITLYNGNNGSVYYNIALSQFTEGATQYGYTFYYYLFPQNGIQNGAPDGIALYNGGSLKVKNKLSSPFCGFILFILSTLNNLQSGKGMPFSLTFKEGPEVW